MADFKLVTYTDDELVEIQKQIAARQARKDETKPADTTPKRVQLEDLTISNLATDKTLAQRAAADICDALRATGHLPPKV